MPSKQRWFIEALNMQAIQKITSFFGAKTFEDILCEDGKTRRLVVCKDIDFTSKELWLSRKAEGVEFNIFCRIDNEPAKDYTNAVRKFVINKEIRMKMRA